MDDSTEILGRAERNPNDVSTQMAAAYHCDAHRTEEEAIVFYDKAWELGVPQDERKGFLLGYGSTLKNVGRLDESEKILRSAIQEFPEDRALPAFLALTLHARGRSDAAIAELLNLLVRLGKVAPDVGVYERALRSYAEELASD